MACMLCAEYSKQKHGSYASGEGVIVQWEVKAQERKAGPGGARTRDLWLIRPFLFSCSIETRVPEPFAKVNIITLPITIPFPKTRTPRAGKCSKNFEDISIGFHAWPPTILLLFGQDIAVWPAWPLLMSTRGAYICMHSRRHVCSAHSVALKCCVPDPALVQPHCDPIKLSCLLL